MSFLFVLSRDCVRRRNRRHAGGIAEDLITIQSFKKIVCTLHQLQLLHQTDDVIRLNVQTQAAVSPRLNNQTQLHGGEDL